MATKKDPVLISMLVMGGIGWAAIVAIVGIMVGYLHCQHAQEHVLDCVKAGHAPVECEKAMSGR